MSFDLGYLFYFMHNDFEDHSTSYLDKFYLKLDLELKSYVDHLNRSILAYQKEKLGIRENLKNSFLNYNEFENTYNDIYSKNILKGLKDFDAHQIAYYESGL